MRALPFVKLRTHQQLGRIQSLARQFSATRKSPHAICNCELCDLLAAPSPKSPSSPVLAKSPFKSFLNSDIHEDCPYSVKEEGEP